MASLISELFSNVWAIFSEAFFSFLLIFIFLVYYNFVNISEKTLFLIAAAGYGIVVALGLQGKKKKSAQNYETEKTLILKNSQMFLMEIFAFLAAVGILVIVYMSETELTIVNIVQSLFIFIIVKIVNWYYLKQQI